MNANRRKIAFVLVALAVQCAAIGWLIWRYEDVVQNGIEVRFKCSAYDPADPFRGRYLRLSVVEECTNLLARVDGQEWDTCYSHNEGLFAELEESADGQWFVLAVADVPQGDSGIWIRPKRVYVEHAVRWGNRLDGEAYDDFKKRREASPLIARVSMPDQLFMNERLAPVAEEALREAVSQDGKGAVAVYRVKDGEIVITDVEIDGKPIWALAKEKP